MPKLLCLHPSELELIAAAPSMGVAPKLLVQAAGAAEIGLSLIIICFWKRRWPLYLAGLSLVVLFLLVLVFCPELSIQAFNPVSLTITSLSLVWIALRDNGTPSGQVDLRA